MMELLKKSKHNQKKLKIGIYIRVSTEEQAQNEEGSIKNQEQRLRGHIELRNQSGDFGDLVEVYIDRAKSGKDTNRIELQRMLKDIQVGKINLVMATELSRISRSIKDFSEIWSMMQDLGCGFMSLRENFDSTTAAGEMLIFSIANLSQFERRQCAERISLNFNARAKRGLYNGGSVPFGYELIQGKPGFLNVNKKNAEVVRACFEYFLKYEGLNPTAKALNEGGYRLEKFMQGGGNKQRLDFFTNNNLHHILRNKAYKGVKLYKENGETFEAKAAWEPIVDAGIFDRVGQILDQNYRRKKPHKASRYPYLLSGIIHCKKCGSSLSGKSAHGNTGKVPYYEHSWATRRGVFMSQRLFDCGNPRRFSGKKLEALVVKKVSEILSEKSFSEKLFQKAQELHANNKGGKELKRLEALLTGYRSQLDALAERVAELPPSVSAKHFYAQMERIESKRKETEDLLVRTKKNNALVMQKPAELDDYWKFVKQLKLVFETGDPQVQEKIIKRLIHKIEVNPSEVILHMIVDESVLPREPKQGSRILHLEALNHFFNFSSNTLTNGTRDRT